MSSKRHLEKLLVMKCKLEDIVDVTMGQSPKSEYYNTEGKGYPFLQGNRTFGFKYPTFDTYTTVMTKPAKAGDVIMSVRAPVGDLNITPVDMCLGSEVHIDMFDDRIEIYSPGGMVSGISLEGKDLLKIPSKRRNPILADIFSRLKCMERRGSGFKKILADYEGQVEFDETKMPVFEADNDDFTLTLYNLNYGINYATQVNENVIENVIEISEEKIKKLMPEYSKKKLAKACEILKMISETPNISIDELRIALDVTDRRIARYISELKDKDIIERKGPDNGGEWKIK